jgi:hypothetical protein
MKFDSPIDRHGRAVVWVSVQQKFYADKPDYHRRISVPVDEIVPEYHTKANLEDAAHTNYEPVW